MRRSWLIVGAAVLALAACSKAGDKQAANGGAGSGPQGEGSVAPAGAPAAPATAPTRKAGLWEQTLSSDKIHQTVRMCVDAATEEKAKWWRSEGAKSGDFQCPEQNVGRTLTGGWKIHSVCRVEGMTVTSDGTATGDFGSTYHVEMTSVTTGARMAEANGTRKMVMDGVWKGPCPAGWTGGDMEIGGPGGMRMNVLNPDAAPAGMPKPGERPSAAQIQQMRAMAEKMKAQSGAQ
jgi:hypothetical protein